MIIRIAREANGLVIDIDGAGLAPPTIVLHEALTDAGAGDQRFRHDSHWKNGAHGTSGYRDQEGATASGPLLDQPPPARRWRTLSYLGATFALALIAGMVLRGGGSDAGAGPHLAGLTVPEIRPFSLPRPAASNEHGTVEYGTDRNGQPWAREVLRPEKNAVVQGDRAFAVAPGETEGVQPAEVAAVAPEPGEPVSAPPAAEVPKAITEALAAPPMVVPARPEGRQGGSGDPGRQSDAAPSSAAPSAPANPAALFGLQP